MKNGLNDEWFEVLLKAAVIQNSMNEIEPYPPQEEIDNLQISDACDYTLFFDALKKGEYDGPIVLEGSADDFEEGVRVTMEVLRKYLD